MAKIAVYTLNSDGTIPDYIINGGYYVSKSELKSPQHLKLVGISEDISTPLPETCISILEDETSLRDYLTSSLPEMEEIKDVNGDSIEVPTDIDSKVSHMLSLLSDNS